jgi:diguanylate cyclase (GGDEF)-like protein
MDQLQNVRENKYKELHITLYLLSAMIFVTAVFLNFNWKLEAQTDLSLYFKCNAYYIIALLLLLIGYVVMIYLNAVAVGVFILSGFIFGFIFVFHNSYLQVLLVIPVAFTAFGTGKKMGCWVAFASGFILVLIDVYKYLLVYESSYDNLTRYFEADLIFIGTLVICAWFVGGVAEIERDSRNRLIDLANLDGLTNIYNHRYFQVYLKSLGEEVKQNRQSLSLIMFDIDRFNYFNETFGHPAGDNILKKIGGILKEKIKKPALAARYGGDEFCVLLPGYVLSAVYETAQEIISSIENINLENPEKFPSGKITVTAGIAVYPEHTEEVEQLIELADQALYKAKNNKKNKIELYFNVLDALKSSCNKSETELLNSVRTLLCIINAKDRYTYGHSERVLKYATMFANYYGLPESELRLLQYGAYLHDIGKIEIDTDTLNSLSKLTESEWEQLKQHPYWGSEIISPVKSLERIRPLILYHHENYDGTGYPEGLGGEDIPLGARIIRIIDSFDAMTTDRPYKKGMSAEEACAEIEALAGKHYDPELCRVFVDLINFINHNKSAGDWSVT